MSCSHCTWLSDTIFVVFTRLFSCGGGLDFILQSAHGPAPGTVPHTGKTASKCRLWLIVCLFHVLFTLLLTVAARSVLEYNTTETDFILELISVLGFLHSATFASGPAPGTVSPTGKTASRTACGFLFAYSTFSSVLYAHDIRFQFLFGSTRFLVRRSARLHLRPDLTPCQGPISDHGYV